MNKFYISSNYFSPPLPQFTYRYGPLYRYFLLITISCRYPKLIPPLQQDKGREIDKQHEDVNKRIKDCSELKESKVPFEGESTLHYLYSHSAGNWRYAAKQFVNNYPEDLIVHCSESNHASLTFDGVDVMGERLAKEVLSVVAIRPELKKISFVGHSLGGLVARYAIGRLYKQHDTSESMEETTDCKTCNCGNTPCIEHKTKGKVAGLEPINFITFATPHLGSRFHKQIPLFRGSHTLEKMACHISWIAGRTGKHLFLKDREHGKPPLLLQMVNDHGDLQFMSALHAFHRRTTYSNVCSDFIVGWKTSSIRRQHELPKRKFFTKNESYPHIVYEEKANVDIIRHENFVGTLISKTMSAAEMEEAMIEGLNRVSWERVDVSFRKSKQRIFAHSTIQVKTYSINSDGADVIFHMIDNFVL